jgi:hypothetical protein
LARPNVIMAAGHFRIIDGLINSRDRAQLQMKGSEVSAVLAQRVEIDAPSASAEAPLVIVFLIDGSRIPAGEDPTTIEIFKDGASVVDCTGGPGIAAPDPCIASRMLVGDDVEIVVYSSSASDWDPAVTAAARLPVAGKELDLDDYPDPTKRKLKVTLADPNIAPIDLTCQGPNGGGAELRVFTLGGQGQQFTTVLPCAQWKRIGKGLKLKGSNYSDGKQSNGPCKKVQIKVTPKGGTIKIACSGQNPLSPLQYDLTEYGQGGIGLTLTAGPVTYCSAFVSPEPPPSELYDNESFFTIRGSAAAQTAGAPPGCWIVD